MQIIEVNIPQAKLKKLAEGKTVTLSSHELNGSQKVHVHPSTYKKIMKARKTNKGIRISISQPEILHDMKLMEGGSIWSWLKDKAWPWLKTNVLPVAADLGAEALGAYTGRPDLAATGRQVLKKVTGIGMTGPKKGRFVKGSQEAKDYMASIRAKKTKSMKGGSFRLA